MIYSRHSRGFLARVAVALTAREVDEYLAKLPNRSSEVGSASAATKRTHLTFIKMALRAAGVADPLRTCELPVVNADVRYFRIDEIKRIAQHRINHVELGPVAGF